MSKDLTPIADSFEAAIAKEQQMSGTTIDDTTKSILKQWFYMGAGTVAGYVFFTEWASPTDYAPYGAGMQKEILDFGNRHLVKRDVKQSKFISCGDLLSADTIPEDGEVFEVVMGESTEVTDRRAMAIYDLTDKNFWFCDEQGLPVVRCDDNSGGMSLQQLIKGWRVMVLNVRDAAQRIPDDWRHMDEAPRDGNGFLAIASIPAEGARLVPYKCYYDQGLGRFQTKRGKDLPNDTNPIAWQPMN